MQSNKSPPAQDEEQDIDISDLQEAIKLNKRKEAGTSKKDTSSFVDPSNTKNNEERALRQYIRRSLAETSGKSATLPLVFTCLQEGDYILSQEEADKVRETLIALSQDMWAIISLHQASCGQ